MRYIVCSMPLFALAMIISSRAVRVSEEHFQQLSQSCVRDSSVVKKRKCSKQRKPVNQYTISKPTIDEQWFRYLQTKRCEREEI